jgi:hypothetical protein
MHPARLRVFLETCATAVPVTFKWKASKWKAFAEDLFEAGVYLAICVWRIEFEHNSVVKYACVEAS